MATRDEISKTQIDRLGDRLRQDSASDDDIRLLDQHRRSFREAYDTVVGTVRNRLHLAPTGRPAKSTNSILAKLRRESIRLAQVQDIAGCRVVMDGVVDQDRAIRSLVGTFPSAAVVDRRAEPSHGYRAVHVIVTHSGKLVEIQIRSRLQHQWAEVSEKWSDFHPDLKYGRGPDRLRGLLLDASQMVREVEDAEKEFAAQVEGLPNTFKILELTQQAQTVLTSAKERLARLFATFAEYEEPR